MAEQLQAGPMTVEKQTVLEIRSLGAPNKQAPADIPKSIYWKAKSEIPKLC